jgi:hypothetical protein
LQARITWAFTVLCELDKLISDPDIALSLGHVQSTLEGSLLRWEGGHCAGREKEQADESTRFASFLGRARFSLPFLDQRIGQYEDEEEDSMTYFSEKKTLPLLRDLSMDPATICKLAAGFCSHRQKHPDTHGTWTFVRVAVRLLTSKNGHLMRESTMSDIVRLCHACARNEVPGYEREFIIRLYTRRVLQLLNEELDPSKKESYGDAGDTLKLLPSEVSLLVRALGELGVRHQNLDESRNNANSYRKLRLATKHSFLNEEHVRSLLPSEAVDLVSHCRQEIR